MAAEEARLALTQEEAREALAQLAIRRERELVVLREQVERTRKLLDLANSLVARMVLQGSGKKGPG